MTSTTGHRCLQPIVGIGAASRAATAVVIPGTAQFSITRSYPFSLLPSPFPLLSSMDQLIYFSTECLPTPPHIAYVRRQFSNQLACHTSRGGKIRINIMPESFPLPPSLYPSFSFSFFSSLLFFFRFVAVLRAVIMSICLHAALEQLRRVVYMSV